MYCMQNHSGDETNAVVCLTPSPSRKFFNFLKTIITSFYYITGGGGCETNYCRFLNAQVELICNQYFNSLPLKQCIAVFF